MARAAGRRQATPTGRSAAMASLASASLALASLGAATPAGAQQTGAQQTVAQETARCAPSTEAVPSCRAEPDGPSMDRARSLYEEGLAHVEGGRWADALSNFRRSYQTSCVPAALLNAATAYRALGRWVEAREAARGLLERHPDMPEALRPVASDLLQEATQQVARLTLIEVPVAPPPTIRLDGQPCVGGEERPVVLAVDPGPRVLDVSAPGRASFHWEQTMEPAGRERIEISLPELPSSDSSVAWGVGLGTAGAVLLGVAIGLAYFFSSQGPEFDAHAEI